MYVCIMYVCMYVYVYVCVLTELCCFKIILFYKLLLLLIIIIVIIIIINLKKSHSKIHSLSRHIK